MFAGEDGYDINVGENTKLTGGAIVSEASADKNRLSTDTLEVAHIHNRAEYDIDSQSIGFSTSASGDNVGFGGGFSSDSDKTQNTTFSALSEGTLEVHSNPNYQRPSQLKTSKEQAHNTLKRIFGADKVKDIEEQTELTQVFAEEAFYVVGDLYQEQENAQANAKAARERYENGELSQAGLEEFERRALEAKTNLPDKAIAHALVGGLTALLGGGDFIKGAFAAGVNEKVAQELKEELPNNPLLKNMVATLVGTSLSGELEGGIIAANADKFNRQLHPAEMVWIEEHAKTFADNEGISEQVAKLRLTQQALKELDLGMRLTLNHSLDTSASEFLKSASNLSFSNDLGQSQALFSLQGNQYVRPALFATEVDIQFYKENVHTGIQYKPGEGLNVFLDDFQAKGEEVLSGLPLEVREELKGIALKIQEDPSYASRYMREVQLSGFVAAVKAYSALNRCVSSVECLSGVANSVKDGAVRQSHALGESGAVVIDGTSKELLNEVYGQDVEGMSKTLLAAQSALVLAEVIPAVKIAQIRKADAGRIEGSVANQTLSNTDLTFNPRFWNHEISFNGNRVFQRDDLIDPKTIDPKTGLTNLELMQSGRAPLGSDGKPINLHHLTQRHNGSIAEVTQSMHQEHNSTLHINPNTIPSSIDRAEFNRWRKNYWKSRANDFDQDFQD